MSKKILVALMVVSVVFGLSCGLSRERQAARSPLDADGWYVSIEEALKGPIPTGGSSPVLVAVMAGGWERYERDVYADSTIEAKLATLRHARVDGSDTRLEAYGLTDAPALLMLTSDDKVITYLEGARDPYVLRRAITRSLEFPRPWTELERSTDPAAQLRYLEVLIEQGKFDTAAAVAKKYVDAPSSPEAAHGLYLYIYAMGERGDMAEAEKAVALYVRKYPQGEDRTAVRWIQAVIAMQAGKDAAALAEIDRILSDDASSPFARQAVLMYAMQYLAGQKRQLAEADKYLGERIAAGGAWADEFAMARAQLRLNIPGAEGQAVADIKQVAAGNSRYSSSAQGLLVSLVSNSRDRSMLADMTLFFQDLTRDPAHSDEARLHLVRLYMMDNNFARAKEEAQTLSTGKGEYADEALLMLGQIALEKEMDPAAAIARFDDAIKRSPEGKTAWPARYGRAMALYLAGDRARAAAEFALLKEYVSTHRFLSNAFSLVLPQGMPPQLLPVQLQNLNKGLKEMEKEPQGDEHFKAFMAGILAVRKGDTAAAERIFSDFVESTPGSLLTDDAYMKLADLAFRDDKMDSVQFYLNRIVTSYKNSDQYENAARLVEQLKKPAGGRK